MKKIPTLKQNNNHDLKPALKIGIVVPHIFMQRDILPHVIFAPSKLAIDLAEGLKDLGQNITLFTPGPVETTVKNITADLGYFEQELAGRGDTYIDLLKKHPFTFITLARQVQSELIAKAYKAANEGKFDVIHIYTNEEDTALPFAQLCTKPVVFTHHDPFNFSVKYKNVFPKHSNLNWISMSLAQRSGMPKNTNWVGNIYHGLAQGTFTPSNYPKSDYIAYLGRIVEPKGLHLAIKAVKTYNLQNNKQYILRVAGKHYAGHNKDTYWQQQIAPHIDSGEVEYLGFIKDNDQKQEFLSRAKALIVPSTFDEPFGMVMIEALACGTPIIGLDSGAVPEVVKNNQTGFVINKIMSQTINKKTNKLINVIDEDKTSFKLAEAIANIDSIDSKKCRKDFEKRFTKKCMCAEHLSVYRVIAKELLTRL